MKKGFTLIELLIVIAVLSILAIASITTYTGVRLKALRQEAYTNLETLRLLVEQYRAENGRYTDDLNNTDAIKNTLKGFKPPEPRMYNYRIVADLKIDPNNPGGATEDDYPRLINDDDDNNNKSCFVAIAEGISGTRVDDDVFVIDCNNTRNF